MDNKSRTYNGWFSLVLFASINPQIPITHLFALPSLTHALTGLQPRPSLSNLLPI